MMRTRPAQWMSLIGVRLPFRRSREDVAARQSRGLRLLVRHAYLRVPYYRRLFDRHGLKPHHIRGVADLHSIPVTERRDLQSLPPGDIVSRDTDPGGLLTFRTSGSSGRPLLIRRTVPEQLVLRTLYMRAMKTMGLRFNDSIALIAGAISARTHDTPRVWRLLRSLDPRRRFWIDALLPPEQIRERLLRFQPDVVMGYANALSRVADMLTADDRKRIRPRFVKADSEVMTTRMRAQIETGFGAPVFEMYDSHEFLMLAWECPASGELHVCDEGLVLEVLRDGRPCEEGERGEVVATALHSYAMPFIRYRLGDIVTRGSESCRCGLPFSTIRSVQGRMIDYFPLPDGRLMHPYQIVDVVLDESSSWLRLYQLTQEREDRFVLRVVPSVDPGAQELDRVTRAVCRILGPGIEFVIEPVRDIRVDPSGKFRPSRSLVRSPYDGLDWEAKRTQ